MKLFLYDELVQKKTAYNCQNNCNDDSDDSADGYIVAMGTVKDVVVGLEHKLVCHVAGRRASESRRCASVDSCLGLHGGFWESGWD